MTENLKSLTKHKTLILFIVFALLLYFVLNELATKRIDNLAETLRAQIAEQQSLLATTAELTARNNMDEVAETIVRDCPSKDRVRFDELLGQLNSGLNAGDLNELNRLFDRCGNFTAQRKAVMVARLNREIEIYDAYVAQLEVITSESKVENYRVDDWKQLASEEKKQGELFNELVTLQGKIIATLLEGKKVNSDEITTILTEVKETQETLLVANKQAAELRSELVSL